VDKELTVPALRFSAGSEKEKKLLLGEIKRLTREFFAQHHEQLQADSLMRAFNAQSPAQREALPVVNKASRSQSDPVLCLPCQLTRQSKTRSGHFLMDGGRGRSSSSSQVPKGHNTNSPVLFRKASAPEPVLRELEPVGPLPYAVLKDPAQRKAIKLNIERLEQYLSSVEFLHVFGLSRDAFAQLPAQTQTQLKKAVGLGQ
jgi:hypothetical protein